MSLGIVFILEIENILNLPYLMTVPTSVYGAGKSQRRLFE